MIGENIRQARKKKGISQEEMAVKLNVVRQTVSKWESGRSVPDAEMLVQISALLDAPVYRLLGIESHDGNLRNLEEELAKRNEALARNAEREQLLAQANKKRGLILLLSFITMLAALSIRNERLAVLLIFGCMAASLVVLYVHLGLLTAVSTAEQNLGPLRLTTLFDLGVLAVAAAVVVLRQSGRIEISLKSEKWLAAAITSAVMLFGGFIAPKLPYNRHTGLRLPWTLQDEDAWNVAHRAIGTLSLPCVLLNLAANLAIANAEVASIAIIALWVAIPGVLSLICFLKKHRR